MGTEKPLLSQKEYLKKYLSKDKNKKKKKPKISSSSHIKRSVIIDDDLGLKEVATVDDEEFNLDYLGDEAPQIAGIVDERPDELKAKEKYGNSLWRTVGEGNTGNDPLQREKNNSALSKEKHSSNYDYNNDSDLSLPRPEKNEIVDKRVKDFRKNRDDNKKNLQKEKSREKLSSDSDLSPERRRAKKDDHSDSDMSPPRCSKSKRNDKESDMYEYRNKKNYSSKRGSMYLKKQERYDRYHYRRMQEHSGSDTPSRGYKHGSRDKRYDEKENRKQREDGKSHSNSRYDAISDSRRYRNKEKHKMYQESRSDSKGKRGEMESKKKKEISSAKEKRTGNKKDSDSDLSPARYQSPSQKKKRKSDSRTSIEERMLDGKRSGLQDAKHLKEELKKLKENEDKLFKKMDPSLLGALATPIQRDRKTGQVRHIEKEREEDKAKAEKKAKTEHKYYKWGKGLKQMQDQEDRIADALHEMSKPLARYRDDKDLDAFLRAQEREGDPMLEYIRNKQSESHNVVDLTIGGTKPKYNGSFMPNRFGIEPGYRWDGVDRSNGYEKKWFEQKNARRAVDEQAYKWSTSDM